MINKYTRFKQRQEGLNRCGGRSELSEAEGCLEASHLDHNKRDEAVYLGQDVIVMCTPFEHYVYHLMFRHKAKLIGLDLQSIFKNYEPQNEFAIEQCRKRGIEYLAKYHGIMFEELTQDEQQKLIAQAWNFWAYYLAIPFYGEM
jgi:formyltetrahydrofolate hydrolase